MQLPYVCVAAKGWIDGTEFSAPIKSIQPAGIKKRTTESQAGPYVMDVPTKFEALKFSITTPGFCPEIERRLGDDNPAPSIKVNGAFRRQGEGAVKFQITARAVPAKNEDSLSTGEEAAIQYDFGCIVSFEAYANNQKVSEFNYTTDTVKTGSKDHFQDIINVLNG